MYCHCHTILAVKVDTLHVQYLTLRTSLVKDLRNINILLQLRALGIIGKMVTGPWMHELYTNSGISNLNSINYKSVFREPECIKVNDGAVIRLVCPWMYVLMQC